jgi:hypothetical protein
VKLRFNYISQYYDKDGPQGHAQEVMKELGIEYKSAEAFTIGDCWVFYDCTNVPDKLPKCIDILD